MWVHTPLSRFFNPSIALLHSKWLLRLACPHTASVLADVEQVDFCRQAAAACASASASNFGRAAVEEAVAAESAELLRAYGRDDGTLGLLEFRRVMGALADKERGEDSKPRRWHHRPLDSARRMAAC